MKRLYLITGACGHLGSTLVRTLARRGAMVRGLILPWETPAAYPTVTYVKGDVCDLESLRMLFVNTKGYQLYVIHTAGIVDISGRIYQKLYEVNVKGTQHVLKLCQEYQVKRLVYVDSVHAIAAGESNRVLAEVDQFSPDTVQGGYAKTKAEATAAVLNAAQQGLDAVVVHPSGILGPYGASGNYLVQLVQDYLQGKLPACVRGGYDFVDVRDVADGCLRAMQRGRKGECYILSNRRYSIEEVLNMVRSIAGGKRLSVLPLWLAKAALPVIQLQSRIRRRRPLYTSYSLYTLGSNDKFSHTKATLELGYAPRDLYCTLCDTIAWMRQTQKPAKRPVPQSGRSLNAAET